VSRHRRTLYRACVGTAVTLGVVLVALAFGAFTSTTASYARLLPPPKWSAPVVIPPPPVTEKIFNGPAVDLSNASDPQAIAPPTRLVIPAIGVDTLVVPLGRAPDGSALVPSGTTYTSWYDLGPRPGQLGPAVVLGHIDSYTGPGVFFRLRSLLPGDDVMVQAGQKLLRFEVWKLQTYPKDHFDTSAVFGPTPVPELRLITCGGPFDTSIGHYEDNVVVFAVLTG
jgi:sortase (surface protein transpeptidase)